VPSTYSNLKIQLMATGENTGTWGNVTNDNLGVAIEQALVETATVTFASDNVTLTLTDTNAAQNARALRLDLTGTTAGARDLIVPAIQKPYLVNNGTADTITVKVTGQTGIAVPAGKSMLLYNNGTDVGLAFNRVVADVVGGNISGNGAGITAMNASEITTGSLANARTSASSSNGASTIVARDASGDFSANNVTVATLQGTTVNATTVNAATVSGTNVNASSFVSDGIGNLRDIPVNTQTTGYTLVVGDAGKFVSTNANVTVPNAVFVTGDVVSVFNSSSSNVTVVQGGAVTLRQGGTANTGNRTLQQYGICTILCTADNNFVIAGAGIL
jgi:hypothetical protein